MKFIQYMTKPSRFLRPLSDRGLLKWVSDEVYLKLVYNSYSNKKLNLDNPSNFTEKLQWLKLYDRQPGYMDLVDKYRVRKIVNEKIGNEYLIPLVGIYDSVDEIDWETLPNKFVLKCTHGSGSNIVCTNKSEFNIKSAKKKLKKWMKKSWYWYGREWPYKDITPRIVCEEFLDTGNRELPSDYKFYCFNGIPYYCQVIRGRGTSETIDFFDMQWRHMPFNGMRRMPMSKKRLDRPKKFDEMSNLARILATDIPFVRLDFYHVNNKVFFGEFTFYPTSGFGTFYPNVWDEKLGSLLTLSNKKTETK